MTVGGIVRRVTEQNDARLVLVQGTRGESGDWLHIRIAKGNEDVKPGDNIWWQDKKAFWTPEPMREHQDVVIEKIGYSWSVPREDRGLLNERTRSAVQ